MSTNPRDFAIEAHGDQKYGDKPYAYHLDDVVAVLHEFGFRDEAHTAAGYLHDVIEDTDVTAGDIAVLFGEVVAAAVAFCTDEPGPNRKTRKAATYERCERALDGDERGAVVGSVVKLADRIANLREAHRTGSSLLSMYRREHVYFACTYYYTPGDGGAEPWDTSSMWAEYDRLIVETT